MKKNQCAVLGLVACLSLVQPTPARAGAKDKWISTKATLALLTSDGLSVRGANVDTREGTVIIHGIVGSEADKAKAEATVRNVDGVKNVTNLLQVVPVERRDRVQADDAEIRHRVEARLATDKALKDVKVASVNDGVVLLKGKVHRLGDQLRAAQAPYTVAGVERVVTEVEVEVKD
jgi:osmotically-inducible protein OsmY